MKDHGVPSITQMLKPINKAKQEVKSNCQENAYHQALTALHVTLCKIAPASRSAQHIAIINHNRNKLTPLANVHCSVQHFTLNYACHVIVKTAQARYFYTKKHCCGNRLNHSSNTFNLPYGYTYYKEVKKIGVCGYTDK